MKACGEIIVNYFQTYRKMTNIDENMRESDFHKRSKGLNEMKVADRLQEFGPNFIKISVPPILYLVFHEVSIPSTIVIQSVKKNLKLNDFGSNASHFGIQNQSLFSNN